MKEEKSLRLVQQETSFEIDELSPIPIMDRIRTPTFLYAVKDDVLTKEEDVQTMYDRLGVEDKKLLWVEGTVRAKGYTHFQENPDVFVEWFAKHME